MLPIPLRQITDDLRIVFEHAQKEAARRHSAYLDVEHLMLGLLSRRPDPAYVLLEQHGVDIDALYTHIVQAVGIERAEPMPVKGFSRAALAAILRASKEAAALGHPVVDSTHLLLALMAETSGAVAEAWAAASIREDDVRAYLRTHKPAGAVTIHKSPAPAGFVRNRPTSDGGRPDVVVIPYRQKRRPSSSPLAKWGRRPWIILGIVLFVAYLVFVLHASSVFTFVLVLAGWIFSLSLHEFSHALVAYWGGDYTVKDKGYLTFNPLKYTHPMLSIIMPLMFLAMGGIGLPGGAVYIERHRLKNRWWGAAVSAAGPLSNLVLALVLSIPFLTGLVDIRMVDWQLYFGRTLAHRTIWQNPALWSAVAFLIVLEITAVLFNLLPFPPLDGFGIIEPLLDARTANQFRQFGTYGLLLIFLLLWFNNPVSSVFWDTVYNLCANLHIPGWLVSEGYKNFMFWRQPPQ